MLIYWDSRTGSALYVLGNVRITQGRLEDVYDLHKKALACWTVTYGEDHHKTGDASHKFGWHLARRGEYMQAL